MLLIGVTIGILLGLQAMWRYSIQPAVRAGVENIVNPQYARGPSGGGGESVANNAVPARGGPGDNGTPGVVPAVPNPAGPHEVARMPGSPLIDDKGVVGGIDGGVKAGAASVGKQVDAAQVAINDAMASAGKINDEAVKGMADLEAGRNAYHAAMRLPDGPEKALAQERALLQMQEATARIDNARGGVADVVRKIESALDLPGAPGTRLASLGSTLGTIGKVVGRIGTPLDLFNWGGAVKAGYDRNDPRGVVVASTGTLAGVGAAALGGFALAGAIATAPVTVPATIAVAGGAMVVIGLADLGKLAGESIGHWLSDREGYAPSPPSPARGGQAASPD
ncbi:MAG: hypothetical protein K1X57_06970 [Gemmataceae bacterium]|nr:hypothetical protein [Gemmataceae bacterium]